MSKQPYRPLSTIEIIDDTKRPVAPAPVATPEPVSQPVAAPKVGRRQSGYRYTVETHEALRMAAFQQRRTIQDIIDEAVLLWLAQKK